MWQMKVTSHGAREKGYEGIDTESESILASWFNDDKIVVPVLIRCLYLDDRQCSVSVRINITINGHTSSDIRFITTTKMGPPRDDLFYAAYRHSVIRGWYPMTRDEVLPLLMSSMRPTFDRFWSCIANDVMTRRNRKLTSSESFKMGVLMNLLAMKDPDDSHLKLIKRLGPIVRETMQSTWSYDMIHFRILDECGPSLLLQYKQEYRTLLFCDRDRDEPYLCYTWRKNYYLGHTESRFRNVLFKLFGSEIQLIMSIFDEWVISDLKVRLILHYVTVLVCT